MNKSTQQKYDDYLLNTPRWQESLVPLDSREEFSELYNLCLQYPTVENFQKIYDWVKQQSSK